MCQEVNILRAGKDRDKTYYGEVYQEVIRPSNCWCPLGGGDGQDQALLELGRAVWEAIVAQQEEQGCEKDEDRKVRVTVELVRW